MAEVVSGEAVVLDVPCARFPSRIIALIIDMLVQAVAGIALLIIAIIASGHLNPDALLAVVVTAIVLILVGYPAAFETLSRGRSLGKMALGLRVVSDDGGPERFRQALVRALASIVEIWSFSGAPALVCSMVSARGKRIGDLFAGTFVIQERLPYRPGLPPVFSVVPPPLLGYAQTLEISRLQDQTAEQAASYLRRVWELTPEAGAEFGQRIAAAVAAQVTPPPPPGTPPAAFLAAVLAVRRQREMARLAALQPPPAAPQYPAPRYPAPQHQAPQYPAGQYPGVQYAAAQRPGDQQPAGQPVPQQTAQQPPSHYPVAQPPAAPAPAASPAAPQDQSPPSTFAPPT